METVVWNCPWCGVEKDEPRILIEMIELLVEQWYVQREHRKSLNQRFDEMINKKKHQIAVAKL